MPVTSPRASERGFLEAPLYGPNGRIHRRQLAEVINRIMRGGLNVVDEVTLTANQATTVVADLRAGPNSHVSFTPLTANAAAEVAAGGMYVSSRGKQTFTITHANNAQTDRTFSIAVLG